MRRKTLLLARAAIIAALYVVLTYITNAFGLASGVIQVRISEALSMLCVFTPAGIYGVTIGCLISNLITGCAPLDVIFGTLATLIGAIGTRILGRKSKFLAPLPTIISNTIIIPIILYYAVGAFSAVYNNFLWSSLILTGDHINIMNTMYNVTDSIKANNESGAVYAMYMISTIPLIFTTAISMKFFKGGEFAAGLKL